MGKTRDIVKKIRDTKGIFHAKIDTIKDKNGMDLTETEDIKKRWQEYMEELYIKNLNDADNHDGVITHIEPDILECMVKWALGMCYSVIVVQSWPTLRGPMDCRPPVFSVLGDSPGKNTGVGCHALLQGIIPTQCLLQCRQILYSLSHQGFPIL